MAVVRPALLLAPSAYLRNVRTRLREEGIQAAVANHDMGALYNWIVRLLDRQGISNAAAISFADRHGGARRDEIESALAGQPTCPKLRSHWHFADCGYRKERETCTRRDLLPWCPLPKVPARKGALSQAAFGLALFIRDVCGGDLVGWVDDRLADADPGPPARDGTALMRAALLDPLVNIVATGPKVWSMILAELLLGGDPQRVRWVTTGASFVAVDSLVHAFLHRTGILRRFGAEHVYGPPCNAPGGCADVIAGLAARIDAREFDAEFPACFPRWVHSQSGIFARPTGGRFVTRTRSTIDGLVPSGIARPFRSAKGLPSNHIDDILGFAYSCPCRGKSPRSRGHMIDARPSLPCRRHRPPPPRHRKTETSTPRPPSGPSSFLEPDLMEKTKAKAKTPVPADDSKVIGTAADNVLPMKGRARQAASAMTAAATEVVGANLPAPESAIVVFGRDDSGKPHASWFGAADAELATKAAGLMRFKVLPITSDEHRAAASGLAQGRVFASGRCFSPFCREAAHRALEAFLEAYHPPMPVEPEPAPPPTATGTPQRWEDVGPGSLVLASMGDDTGWFESVVVEARSDDLFVLRWQGWPDDPEFARRLRNIALLPAPQ